MLIGRTHVQTVAEARKGEVEKFLRQLLTTSTEVSEVGKVIGQSFTVNQSWHAYTLSYQIS